MRSMIFALIVVVLATTTSSFATASAIAPNGQDDKNVGNSIQQIHNILLLRGGAAAVGIIPTQEEEHATIQNEYSSAGVGTCTTSCSTGTTCTPESVRCPKLLSRVCGCDGNTYSNKCEAFKSGVNVERSGGCLGKEIDDHTSSMARMVEDEEDEGVVEEVSSF